MISRFILCLALVATALCGGACSAYRMPEGRIVGDGEELRIVDEALEEMWPASFRLVHQVQVRVAGREMHLLGYLAVVRGQGLRAVAMGEMGGKFLDLLVDDSPRILHKPTRLPERPIREGVGADLALAFDPRPGSSRVVVRTASGERLIAVDMRDGETVETIVSVADRRVLELRRYRGRKPVCVVTLEDWRVPTARGASVPHRVRFADRRWHYEMTAELTRWRGTDVAPEVLVPEDGEQ